MKNQPDNLIERMERETGQRIDEPGSMAMAGLFGAIARAMGQNHHRPEDDVAVGIVLQHQMSPEGEAERKRDAALGEMLANGLPPDLLF